ncbi:unnamed protein product [Adineta steineri]|uniref:G-protein coupled receptors family 1 profile domain-containing protein n=1 Tax=Adineta steineri TaxID=433720 RepID=A0A819DN13_9BILA|nr:unnamed protein product [Adineta steineri]
MPALNTSSTTATIGPLPDGVIIPYIVRFWLFLVSDTLSVTCCIFVLFHFLSNSTLRHSLHNHAIIIALFLCLIRELTTVPWVMHFYLYGVVWIKSPAYCMIWKFIDSTVYTSLAKLVGWTSVERHILIFHSQWIATNRRRYLIHYTPLILIVLYGVILYGITSPMNDCNRSFIYNSNLCSYYSCIYNSAAFSLYEFMSGGVLSSSCMGFGSIFLVIRIVFQKRRLQRQIQWRKYRKMTIQLLSVTSIFVVIYLPPILLGIAKQLGVPSYVGVDYTKYSNFFAHYVIFLFPFTCLGTLPHLRKRMRKSFRYFWRRKTRTIVPQQIMSNPLVNNVINKQKTTAV